MTSPIKLSVFVIGKKQLLNSNETNVSKTHVIFLPLHCCVTGQLLNLNLSSLSSNVAKNSAHEAPHPTF